MTTSAVPSHALVIGAGVIGLTTAVVLAEQGTEVEIWTAEPPDQTTSMAAGAMWGPYLVEPVEKVREWSLVTLRKFHELAEDPATGVKFASGIEASRELGEPPDWAIDLPGFTVVAPDELPDGFRSGVRFKSALVDMPRYISYLVSRLRRSGAMIDTRRINCLSEATAVSDLVVNCSGSGARRLTPDVDVRSIRGQLVSVRNLTDLREFFSEDTGPSEQLLHIYPHGDAVVLGGVAEPDNWSRMSEHSTATEIIARCAEIYPELASAEVINHRVGLRPTRPSVRVEIEDVGIAQVVHNYGHGGAGVSLSWGCAHEVRTIIER